MGAHFTSKVAVATPPDVTGEAALDEIKWQLWLHGHCGMEEVHREI
jgi:hypothetical protein